MSKLLETLRLLIEYTDGPPFVALHGTGPGERARAALSDAERLLALLQAIERKCPQDRHLDPAEPYLLARMTGVEIAQLRETILANQGGPHEKQLASSPVSVAALNAGGGAEALRSRRGKPLPVRFDSLTVGERFEFAEKSNVGCGKYNGTFRKISTTEYRGQRFKATPEPFVLVIPGPLDLRPGLVVFVDAHGEHGEDFSGVIFWAGAEINVIAPDGEVYQCCRSHTYPASQSYVERFINEA